MPGKNSTRHVHMVAIVLVVIGAMFFWKLRIIDPAVNDEPLHLTLTNVDFFTYIQPASTNAANALRSGQLPLWNPYQAGGHPALASIPVGALYPLNFPYLIFPVPTAIEAVVVLHLILAGAFMFFYARNIGLGIAASAASAIVFMFSGFLSSRAVWFPPALAACVWLPLALLSIEKLFVRATPRWVFGLSATIAMPILAGWLQIWVYTMYAIGVYSLVRLISSRSALGPQRLNQVVASLVAGAALGLCLSAVQLLPTFELQRLTPRSAGTLSQEQLIHFGGTNPTKLVAQATDPTSGPPRLGYLGMGALLLLPLSLFSHKHRARVLTFWSLLLLSVCVSLTHHTPVYALFQKIPSGALFRSPERIFFLYAFCGAALCGFSIQLLGELHQDASRQRVRAIVSAVVAVALLLALAVDLTSRGQVLLLSSLCLIIALALSTSSQVRSFAAIALVSLLMGDLFLATQNTSKHPFHIPELREHEQEQASFNFLRRNQGLERTYIRSPSKFSSKVISKHATLQKIYSITDYEPLSLGQRGQFFRLLEVRPDEDFEIRPFNGWLDADPASKNFRLLDLMSVRFAMIHRWDQKYIEELVRAGWETALEPRQGQFVIMKNPSSLPRAYLASDIVLASSADHALAAIAAPDFNPRISVVLESREPISDQYAGRTQRTIRAATITRYDANEITIEVIAAQAGYLVLTDNFYPGWSATIDGEPTGILRANALFRAVEVPLGTHVVQFRYRPMSFFVGATLTLSSLAAFALYAVWRSRRNASMAGSSAIAIAFIFALLGASTGCSDGSPETPAREVENAEQHQSLKMPPTNVVVFVIDTLRSDHLGSYGYERPVSPVIDKLAQEGVVFEDTSSVAPRTWQSFTSILTGLYPPRHGVRYIFSPPLAKTIPTLASTLASRGYQTAAFDGMTFLRGMTGDAAFAEYHDPKTLAKAGAMLNDDALLQHFEGWLENATPPFFAFLRVTAPHWTYICHPVFHDDVEEHDSISHQFNTGSHGLGLTKEGLALDDLAAYRERFYDFKPSNIEREHMILHYDECIRESDAAIGRSLKRLESIGLDNSTLVVITADHGESFGEHGYLQHGPQVDAPVVNVPLIFRFPDSLAENRRGRRVAKLAQTIDIMPTILDLLDFDAPVGLDGTSLLPAINGDRGTEQTAYAEAGRAFVGVDPEVFLPGVRGKQRMVRNRDWKLLYIPNEAGGLVRLFDLRNDPGENQDVAAANPNVVAELRRALDDTMANEPGGSVEKELSEEEKESLRALGYL
ncbi:MAG: arylsulfatase A-like enzyme [Myxococcota bacterium]